MEAKRENEEENSFISLGLLSALNDGRNTSEPILSSQRGLISKCFADKTYDFPLNLSERVMLALRIEYPGFLRVKTFQK